MKCISKIYERYPSSNPSVFVDDTALQAKGTTFDAVLEQLIPAEVLFAEDVSHLKLILSPKAKIVASHPKLATIIQKELRRYGIFFNVASHARDLGITHTAATSRPNKLLLTRKDSSKSRILRISRIARVSRGARKLFT